MFPKSNSISKKCPWKTKNSSYRRENTGLTMKLPKKIFLFVVVEGNQEIYDYNRRRLCPTFGGKSLGGVYRMKF